jgi:DNA-binding LacI/PurR family transcriptional regulator
VDNFKAERQAELIEYYSGHLKVDGIFVFQMKTDLKKGFSDTPIVAMLSSKDVRVDSVRIDFTAPLREAIEHLYASGHKNIVFFGEKLTVYKAEKFENIARSFPIKHSFITSEHRFEKAGEDCVEKMLRYKEKPTAIVCAYDNIALGAIKHLKAKGFRVPDDFSVIGINNINSASLLDTPLSTIDARPDDICMIAWDLFEKKRKNKY